MEETQQVYTLEQGDDEMDIERLKKLNSLAGELKHQGIAQNHEDAAYLAVNMVGEAEEQCLSDMHINDDQSLVIREIIKDKPVKKAEIHTEHETAQEEQHVVAPVVVQPSITKEDVEQIMQSFATALAVEFTTLQKKVEETNQQLAQLQQKINERPIVQQQTVPQQKMTQFMEEAPVRPQGQEAVQTAPIQHIEHPSAAQAAANPRTGSFVTNDVCIEKMFYFGAKR